MDHKAFTNFHVLDALAGAILAVLLLFAVAAAIVIFPPGGSRWPVVVSPRWPVASRSPVPRSPRRRWSAPSAVSCSQKQQVTRGRADHRAARVIRAGRAIPK